MGDKKLDKASPNKELLFPKIKTAVAGF